MAENKTLEEALKLSIEMEKRGYDFYKKSAVKAVIPVSRKIFTKLAEAENIHIDVIRQFYARLTAGKPMPQFEPFLPSFKELNKTDIFGKSEAERLKDVRPSADELSAYEIAMKLENDSYDYYKKVLEKITEPEAQKLYRFLLKQEKSHYDLISGTYAYLKNPAQWFIDEEKPIVEG